MSTFAPLSRQDRRDFRAELRQLSPDDLRIARETLVAMLADTCAETARRIAKPKAKR